MPNYYSSSPLPHEVAWPQWRYHATKDPVQVRDEAEAAALGEGWSDKYIHRAYPKAKYRLKKDPKPGEVHYEVVAVDNPEAESKLGSGWSDKVPPEPEAEPEATAKKK